MIYIIRYPNLDTRIPSASNITATPATTIITTDDILSYHLQETSGSWLQKHPDYKQYRGEIKSYKSPDKRNDSNNASQVVEMAYSTNSAPDEIRRGYFILTATTATPPNLGTTKGYAVFYEGNSTTRSSSAPEIATVTAASSRLAPTPLPPPIVQAFDSFELVGSTGNSTTIAQEAQAAQPAESGDEGSNDNDDNDGNDDNGAMTIATMTIATMTIATMTIMTTMEEAMIMAEAETMMEQTEAMMMEQTENTRERQMKNSQQNIHRPMANLGTR